MSINFTYIDVDEFDLDLKDLRSWILRVAACHNFEVGQIHYVICDDNYLHKINIDHLQHDTYTDIITFDFSRDRIISGELYLSRDRIFENATLFSDSFEKEILRVIIHGILHLCGFKDKSEEEIVEMRKAEDDALALFYDN